MRRSSRRGSASSVERDDDATEGAFASDSRRRSVGHDAEEHVVRTSVTSVGEEQCEGGSVTVEAVDDDGFRECGMG